MTASQPLVSIGLPVYNGANYIETAVAAILSQSYPNLELIISDNASTDDTGRICEEIVARDPRVKYSRNETNLGAAANYNRVFHLSRGKYFKWAAHDDVLAPTYIERVVAVLESNGEVVLCSSRTSRIDPAGEVTGTYPSDLVWADPSPARRFHSLVFTQHACVIVFGLCRRDVLARTPLIAPYINSDRVLLAELGLSGALHEIPDELFYRRDHPGSSLRAFPDPRKRVVWFDPSRSSAFAFPEWNPVIGYAAAVSRAALPLAERMKCYRSIAAWSIRQWRPLLADFKYAAMGLVARKSA